MMLGLCMLFFFLLTNLAAAVATGNDRFEAAKSEDFTLSNGDTIRCVLLEDQLSLADVKKHEVQIKPSERYLNILSREKQQGKTFQLFEEEARPCNEGAIPVLVDKKTVLESTGTSGMRPTSVNQFSTAHLSGSFSGMQTTMNVWKPHVEKESESSMSQLWVASRKQGKLNTIEAGWRVTGAEQDPRLFIFWTADEYDKTGCTNLACKGFVQVSNKIVLGGALKASVLGSTQFEHTFRVFQDHATNNWWLRINNIDVGYWPASLFNSLKQGAELIVMGGKVAFQKAPGDRHTKTEMGSGLFPEKGFKQAAYHRGIEYLDQSGKPNPASAIKYITGAPGCYHSTPASSKEWGAAFFFGGPGFSKQCP